MAIVTVNDSTLTDIADSIRAKLGVQTTYKPSEMPDAIDSISGGGGTQKRFVGTVEAWGSMITSIDRTVIDFSKDWIFFARFKLSEVPTTNVALFGTYKGTYYSFPSIELQYSGGIIWVGISANGSSWTKSTSLRDITFAANVYYRVKLSWDSVTKTATITFFDETNETEKSATISEIDTSGYTPANGRRVIMFANNSNANSEKKVLLDLGNTYVKNDGAVVWGMDTDNY